MRAISTGLTSLQAATVETAEDIKHLANDMKKPLYAMRNTFAVYRSMGINIQFPSNW